MGNKTVQKANTEKITFDDENDKYRIGGCEMQGWRNKMEDACFHILDFDTNTSIFGVLDGHGGPQVSDFVAKNFINVFIFTESYKERLYQKALVDTFVKFDHLLSLDRVNDMLKEVEVEEEKPEELVDVIYNFSEEPPEETTNEVFDKSFNSEQIFETDYEKVEKYMINGHEVVLDMKEVSRLSEKNYLVANNVGTTANIVFIKENTMYIANVGDSLAVLFKGGKAIMLNREHKVTMQSEISRIKESGSEIISGRVDGRLNLTRAIGDLSFKGRKNKKYYQQAVISYPEVLKVKLTKDCEFLIMGCDGIFDCVDIQELCNYVAERLRLDIPISSIIKTIFDQSIATDRTSSNLNRQGRYRQHVMHDN